MLRGLRMRGQAPTGALCVATDREDAILFEEIKRPVIEVWRRDAGELDWSPVAGLWVVVLIRNWPTDLRMALFDTIRAAQPLILDWLATSRAPHDDRQIVGKLHVVNGEPREMWVTPETAVDSAPEGDVNKGGWYSYGCV